MEPNDARDEGGLLAHEVGSWLRSQPHGALIPWYAHEIGPTDPVADHWVDVLCAPLQEAAGCSWVWTIATEFEDTEQPDPLNFAFPPDYCVYQAHDTGSPLLAPTSVAVAIGEGLPPEEAEVLNSALAAGSAQACVVGGPGWTAGQITRALQWWVARHADRPDLRVVWDPDGPKAAYTSETEAVIEAMDRGIEPTYLLKPGEGAGGEGLTLIASEQAMDFFLQELMFEDEKAPDD